MKKPTTDVNTTWPKPGGQGDRPKVPDHLNIEPQPDQEQQDYDPHLGEQLDSLTGTGQLEPRGTDPNAYGDEHHDQRLP
jgi:hypothetical protein